MFDTIAPRYELVNRLMTLRARRDGGASRTVAALGLPPGSVVLDVAAGTGDLCEECRAPSGHASRSASTSRSGCSRRQHDGAGRRSATPLRLPVASGAADGVVCGFALRNFTDLGRCARGDGARAATRRARSRSSRSVSRRAGWPRAGLLGVVQPRRSARSAGALRRATPTATSQRPSPTCRTPPSLRAMLSDGGFSGVNRHLLSGGLSQLYTATRDGTRRDGPRARRAELDVPRRRGARRRCCAAAAREGVLHATDDLVRARLGAAITRGAARRAAGGDAPPRRSRALDASSSMGDAGPGGSGVWRSGALPFDAAADARSSCPRLLCVVAPGCAVDLGDPGCTTGGAKRPRRRPRALRHRGASRRLGLRPQVVALDDHDGAAAYPRARCALLSSVSGAATLRKVVLARESSGPVPRRRSTPPRSRRLSTRSNPTCDALRRAPTGAGRFVGASPELIVATADGAVMSHPLAGTVALSGASSTAGETIAGSLASAKNQVEHAVVVDDIVTRLAPLCDAVTRRGRAVDRRASRTYAHLGTWIDGKLLGADAVPTRRCVHLPRCTPRRRWAASRETAALELIDELEETSRGVWAGAVGWVDADGTSTWMLAHPRRRRRGRLV